MTRPKRLYRSCFMLLVALTLGGCMRPPGPPLHHEIFRAVHGTACVAPPQVSLSLEKMSGTEDLVTDSLALEDALYELVTGALERKGYHVPDALSLRNLSQRQELQDAVADLQKKHDALLPLIHRDRSGTASGRFSLGPEAGIVGDAAGVDLIAFVRLEGSALSGGKRTLYFLLSADPFVPSGYAALFVTLVNARDGTVLASLSSHSESEVLKNTVAKITALVERAFWALPPRGGSPAQ